MEPFLGMGILGFIAILITLDNSAKIRRLQRLYNNANFPKRIEQNMRDILSPYIGNEINLDFYEDEECSDMEDKSSHTHFTLLDVDDKWALVNVKLPRKEYRKLIRLSTIKGVSAK